MTPHRDRLLAGEYEPSDAPDLDAMTKAELLDHAKAAGIQVDPSASKADVRAVIDAAGKP
jgi:hypothetical protein